MVKVLRSSTHPPTFPQIAADKKHHSRQSATCRQSEQGLVVDSSRRSDSYDCERLSGYS